MDKEKKITSILKQLGTMFRSLVGNEPEIRSVPDEPFFHRPSADAPLLAWGEWIDALDEAGLEKAFQPYFQTQLGEDRERVVPLLVDKAISIASHLPLASYVGEDRADPYSVRLQHTATHYFLPLMEDDAIRERVATKLEKGLFYLRKFSEPRKLWLHIIKTDFPLFKRTGLDYLLDYADPKLWAEEQRRLLAKYAPEEKQASKKLDDAEGCSSQTTLGAVLQATKPFIVSAYENLLQHAMQATMDEVLLKPGMPKYVLEKLTREAVHDLPSSQRNMLLACDPEIFALKMGHFYLHKISEAIQYPDAVDSDSLKRAGAGLSICIDHKPDLARDVQLQLKAALTLVELGGGIVPDATRSIVSALFEQVERGNCHSIEGKKQTLDGHHL